jgi:hypothetical protein
MCRATKALAKTTTLVTACLGSDWCFHTVVKLEPNHTYLVKFVNTFWGLFDIDVTPHNYTEESSSILIDVVQQKVPSWVLSRDSNRRPTLQQARAQKNEIRAQN